MRSFARLGQVVDDTALTFGPRAVPLSVLDLAPVPDGGTAAQALHATIDLARRAERLGYRRVFGGRPHKKPRRPGSGPPPPFHPPPRPAPPHPARPRRG